MNVKKSLLVFSILSLGALSLAHAQEAGSQYDEAKEAEIEVKAKKRLYPGGRDEGDLKVQAQVITPVRKLAPQAEVKEESADE
ncbi:hypothetical protein D3C87_1246100 [compost metagenome]